MGFAYGTVALQWTLCVSAALGTAYSTDVPLLRWKKYHLRNIVIMIRDLG